MNDDIRTIAAIHHSAVTGDWRDIEPAGDVSHPMHPDHREDAMHTYITTLFDPEQLRLIARAMNRTVDEAVEQLGYAERERRELGEL
jgi:hypothetical protein